MKNIYLFLILCVMCIALVSCGNKEKDYQKQYMEACANNDFAKANIGEPKSPIWEFGRVSTATFSGKIHSPPLDFISSFKAEETTILIRFFTSDIKFHHK